jgi:hypothetical protein
VQKNNGAVTHQTDAFRHGGYPPAEQPTASRGARGLVEIGRELERRYASRGPHASAI